METEAAWRRWQVAYSERDRQHRQHLHRWRRALGINRRSGWRCRDRRVAKFEARGGTL